jgi:hypothetical protein
MCDFCVFVSVIYVIFYLKSDVEVAGSEVIYVHYCFLCDVHCVPFLHAAHTRLEHSCPHPSLYQSICFPFYR